MSKINDLILIAAALTLILINMLLQFLALFGLGYFLTGDKVGIVFFSIMGVSSLGITTVLYIIVNNVQILRNFTQIQKVSMTVFISIMPILIAVILMNGSK